MRNLLRVVTVVFTLLFFSCKHKDLCYENMFTANINVVFDWKKAPDADVETMRLYLFPLDGGKPLPYEFTDIRGGKITVPVGRYRALCINSDTDSLLFRNIDAYDTFEAYAPDGSMNVATYSAFQEGRAVSQRVGSSPDRFYTDRMEDLYFKVSKEDQNVFFYPDNLICRYRIEVRNVSNLQYVAPGFVTGGLSGMSEGVYVGQNKLKSESMVIPFEMTSDGVSTLKTEFLTFGQHESTQTHKVAIYVVMPDGNDKLYVYDVTDQVHSAPNPRDVYIILDGLPLPKPIVNGGGFQPSVDNWEDVEVDLPMK